MLKYQIQSFEQLDNHNLYDILALREKVFTFEQKCTDYDFDGLDKQAIHVFGKIDNTIFAAARILPPNIYKKGVVSFGRIVIKKSFRNKGYGKALMTMIMQYIREHYSNYPIEFSAQFHLKNFYGSFVCKTIGKPYDEGGIPHVKMRSTPDF